MDPMTSEKSWRTAPILFFAMAALLVAIWAILPAERLISLFDRKGSSPIEIATLGFFALLIPLTFLASPFGGSAKRKALLNFDVSVLAIMAIVRETDLHKILFAKIWPSISSSFTGTVFKMKFLKASHIPLMPKLFVLAFFIIFFAFTAGTLFYFGKRLFKGIFSLHPVAWTWAVFGGCGTMVVIVDRLPAFLRHHGFDGPLLDKHSGSLAALFTAFEEGGEMMMALFALMGILQAHLFLREEKALVSK